MLPLTIPHDYDNHPDVFDYIVVGSGPGGGPLAANLARAGHTVLLLEAGDDQGNNLDEMIPIRFANWEEDPSQRWDFFVKHYDDEIQAGRDPKMTWSTPDGGIFVGTDPPAGSKQLGIYYPRSGTLGGCAAHNAMVAVLPRNEDWDHIAELTKDDSWRAKNMRHLFKRLERNNYLPKDSQLHGFDGWFETNLGDHSTIDATEPVVSAALSVTTGHRPPPNNPLKSVVKDINGHDPERRDGVYQVPMHMTGQGKRSSPRDFLVATANAKNAQGGRRYPLFVQTHSFATRILFDDHQHNDCKPKAVGIEYFEGQSLYQADPRWTKRRPGVKKRAYATREVIISCGVFNTPQLLNLSGIGAKDELERLNIDVVVDLPGVGKNLQDNYEYSVVSKAQDTSLSSLTKSTSLTAGDPLLEQWIRTGKGPYASNAIPFALLHTSTEAEDHHPDLFMFGGAINFTGFFPGMSTAALVPSDWTWDILKIRSRNNTGTVTLRSANPFERPDINFDYFPTTHGNAKDTEKDLEAMKQGAELARRINKEIKGSAAPFAELQPGANVTSDAAIKQSIRDDTFGHHASCTVAIGPDSSTMACLDSQFRVRGVANLRVVDASSFPRVVGSFPTMAIAILAEKATDVILQDVSRVDGSDKVLDGVCQLEVLVEDEFDDQIVFQQAIKETLNGKKRPVGVLDNGEKKRSRRAHYW